MPRPRTSSNPANSAGALASPFSISTLSSATSENPRSSNRSVRSDFPEPGGPSKITPAPSRAAQLAWNCPRACMNGNVIRSGARWKNLVGVAPTCHLQGMIETSAIQAAAARIAAHVRQTPVLRLAPEELGLGVPVVLKLELTQYSGSFKPRGAFNRMLASAVPGAGVITASGGNHGAAVAYAAQQLGLRAEIFVPTVAPQAKLAKIAAYGATLTQFGATYAEALGACRARQAETGAMEVHAYDHPDVLAGQGTLGRELEADAPELTHVLVGVGGGGLIGGIAAWYAGRTAVIGVEPEGCPGLHDALAAGRPVDAPVGGIAADSLGARRVGDIMFGIARKHMTASVLVPDSAILAAQRLLWERAQLVAEPGGATALAALLCRAWVPPAGAVVGVIVCGGNTDPGLVA
jgi:threonine dehydratase